MNGNLDVDTIGFSRGAALARAFASEIAERGVKLPDGTRDEAVAVGVPWNKPKELDDWSQPTSGLQGHQSDVPPIRYWFHVVPVGLADHPGAGWDAPSPGDQLARPDWWFP